MQLLFLMSLDLIWFLKVMRRSGIKATRSKSQEPNKLELINQNFEIASQRALIIIFHLALIWFLFLGS